MNGFHLQCVAKANAYAVLCINVRQPIPAKYAFNADNFLFNIGENRSKKISESVLMLWFDTLVYQDLTILCDNNDIHFSGVQIDSAVILMLLIVKFHRQACLY